MLEQSEGRGPGSGVHAAPYSVALLLVAILATDSLSEIAEKVKIFAPAKSIAADGRSYKLSTLYFKLRVDKEFLSTSRSSARGETSTLARCMSA